MPENQNNPQEPISPKPPTLGSDLLGDTSVEEISVADKDEEAVVAGVEAVGKVSIFFAHISQFIKKVWTTPKYRYGSLAGLLLFIGLLSWWPTTRHAALNTAGVRATVRVTIVDDKTDLPITNVRAVLGDSPGTTDDEGIALFQNVRLGTATLTTDKSAYASLETEVQVGMGSNTLDTIALTPIGTTFSFNILDWLSKEPIENATITFDDSEATTDSDGIAQLAIPPIDSEQIQVSITAEGYHLLESELDTTLESISTAELVAAPNNYFVSRRNGNYDIYSSRLDGKDQKLIIPGTGNESDDIRLTIDPTNQFGLLVSTRTGIRDPDGRLQKTLHAINLEEPSITQVDISQDIQLVGWIDSALIFVRIGEGESTFSPRRHQIISYDVLSEQTNELEASNHFNDVKIIQNKIYYAADDSFRQESPKPYLFTMNADGTNKQAIIERQSWTIFQSDYSEISVNTTKNGWFNYDIQNQNLVELGGQPSKLQDKRYVDNPSGEKSAWIDSRDGKGVLLVFNTQTGQEDIVHQVGGLQAPIRWINDDKIIFRVSNDQETGDYIVDLQGGEPQKITDTSNVSSDTRWFYY